jgi:co-chaperonin GroES (HSP10)
MGQHLKKVEKKLEVFQDNAPASLVLPEPESTVTLTFEPLYNMVQVKLIEDTRDYRSGNLFLPQNSTIVRDGARFGEVISVGCGHLTSDGVLRPLRVKPGDKVYFAALAGAEIRLGSEKFTITREEEIIGIVREAEKVH